MQRFSKLLLSCSFDYNFKWLLCKIDGAVMVIVTLSKLMVQQNSLQETKQKHNSNVTNEICNIPVIDPFDQTVMNMIQTVSPLVCKGEKNLTFYHKGKLMITPGNTWIVPEF